MHRVVPLCFRFAMAATATRVGGSQKGGHGPNPNVEELFRNLNLTEEEGAVVEFSDAEEKDEVLVPAELALVGKVLAPMPIHISTVRSAMKPVWGNPVGMKLRQIGEKSNNMFIAEFGNAKDMEKVLMGTPWMVGKYAVLLQDYDAKLSASDIVFDRMEIWARIPDLPLGWMNRTRGSKAMALLGHVTSMDVDVDGKASGVFLRARVAIEVDKPIKCGVLLRMSKKEEPKWFHVQYERLPYICFSCGRFGHSELECPTPAV